MACQASSILNKAATPATIETPVIAAATQSPVNTSEPERLLTICMGREPASLFLYGDFSLATRNVRQAIYDGPFDVIGFQVVPVILAKTPALENGGVVFETAEVQAGEMIVDGYGNLVKVGEGVNYRPPGCNRMDCLAAYNGEDVVQTDQMVVRFELLPGLLWSDGLPLSADDSVYSYEIAKSLYPQVRADLLLHTSVYQALDANTIEWRAVPGYRDPGFATNFFAPLPRHAWGNLAVQDLFSAETSTRKPIGWGPYAIEEWIAGDHITLIRNPNYFRQDQDIPRFDKLVFRFVPDKDQAKLALLAGECDLLDETVYFSPLDPQLVELESEGKAQIVMQAGVAWEHVDFDILPVVQPDENRNMLFQLRETRQAIAMCIDRQRLVDELFRGKSLPSVCIDRRHQ